MSDQMAVAVVGGLFLLLSAVLPLSMSVFLKRIEAKFDKQETSLSKRLDDYTKFSFFWGEQEAHDELTRLTLAEKSKIRVTRFNPRRVQRQKRYFEAVGARILGISFEGTPQLKLERYNRLTSLNSEENKASLIEQVEYFLEKGADNLVLRVTADKNDFELLLFERAKTVAFCFHDPGTQVVIHSCMVSTDRNLFEKFSEMYDKLWNEDILLEIDFSQGRAHVLTMLEKLRSLNPIMKDAQLSPLENIIHEANLKIEACRIVVDQSRSSF